VLKISGTKIGRPDYSTNVAKTIIPVVEQNIGDIRIARWTYGLNIPPGTSYIFTPVDAYGNKFPRTEKLKIIGLSVSADADAIVELRLYESWEGGFFDGKYYAFILEREYQKVKIENDSYEIPYPHYLQMGITNNDSSWRQYFITLTMGEKGKVIVI
jgi:hypothetical protein